MYLTHAFEYQIRDDFNNFFNEMVVATATYGSFAMNVIGLSGFISDSDKDADINAYYGKALLWAAENGIVNGTSDTAFSPEGIVTRGQTVSILYRYAKGEAKGENPFNDVKESDYFYDAVLWAVANNITTGTGETTFSPENPCTRAQIVTFLYRDLS